MNNEAMLRALALPPVVMASIALYVGASHALLRLRRACPRYHLTFAVVCWTLALYDLSCAGLYNSSSIGEGAYWQRLQYLALIFSSAAFPWFIADYTEQRSRVFPVGMLFAYASLLAAFVLDPGDWFCAADAAVKHGRVPLLNIVVTYYEKASGPLVNVLILMGVFVFVHAFVAGGQLYKRGQRKRAIPLILGLTIFGLGVANDAAITLGLYYFIYTIEFSFMGLVILMAHSLAGEITRAAKMEHVLHDSERRYRGLVEGGTDLFAQVDREGRLTFVNHSLAALLELTPEACVGRAAVEMIHADDRQDVERSFAKCVRNNVSQFGFECRQVSRTGEVRHILWAATTHADESGKIDLVSFVGRDISERKRIEAEQQARLDRLQTQQAIAVGMATHPAVATGNVEMASNALTEASAEAMNVERVGVYLMSQDGRELKAADVYTRTSARHIDGPSLPIGDCPRYFEYLRSDRVIPAVHAHTDKRMSELIAKSMAPYEVSSRLDAPVRVAGMLVGVVSFQHVGPVRIWTDDEIGFACDVADLIAQAQLNDERRRTEASLKTSEERFRTLAENIPGVIYLCKYEPRCSMLYLNNTIEQLTGYPKSEFFSDRISLAALYHPDDAAEIHAQINEALSLRVPYHLTYRLKHRTGEWRWIEEHGVGLYHDDRPEAIEGYMIDVTTRRREAEERLLLSEAIAQAAEIVIVTDTNGVIQYVNPAFEKTTGYARQEAVGLTPRIMKSGRHSEEFYREMWQALGAGQSWRGRFVNKKKDGSLYTEEALHFPVRDARGRIIRYVGVKRDISEEVKLEEQLRQAKKMEAIGQLAGGVAHDFNNLLTPILGHAELLLMRDDLDETLRTSLGEVQRAAENARDLTQQLLAFSRRQVIEMRPLDLGRIVLRVTRMFRRTLRENIEIVLNLSPDLGCVRGDAVQMEQVLMNLILNAQDAMNRGGLITIETANCYFEDTTALTHQELKPGSYVMLAVSDSGTGMSHETMEHLFEPFFTTKSLGKGTGLGLATVYGVIKQHQGDIYVYSEPDRGTTFKIYLPEVKERPAALTGGEGEAGKIRRGAETIMVVEDNEQVRMFACAVLRSHGYRVVEAASAEECLVTCETFYGPIHLLLSDIVMPGLNGRELYTLLVEQRPDLKVLFMSGYTDDVIVHQGFLDAEIEFIQKPFTVDRLTRRVRECLDQQRDD